MKCPYRVGITAPGHFRWAGRAPAQTVTPPDQLVNFTKVHLLELAEHPSKVGSREVQEASTFRWKTRGEEVGP